MPFRLVRIDDVNRVQCCPLCGQRSEFRAISERAGEDCCEVWVVCQCGYDPTETRAGSRFESVWGHLNQSTVLSALQIWNELITQIFNVDDAMPPMPG